MKEILLLSLALLTMTHEAKASTFLDYKNTECRLNLRAKKDEVVFQINENGKVINLKELTAIRNDENAHFKVNAYPYVNPDRTCGIVNPTTNGKYQPIGYREGRLKKIKRYCIIDRRALKDETVFEVEDNGDITSIKHQEIYFYEKDKKLDSKIVAMIPYLKIDGSCGVISPLTLKKYRPLGYRKGKIIYK